MLYFAIGFDYAVYGRAGSEDFRPSGFATPKKPRKGVGALFCWARFLFPISIAAYVPLGKRALTPILDDAEHPADECRMGGQQEPQRQGW